MLTNVSFHRLIKRPYTVYIDTDKHLTTFTLISMVGLQCPTNLFPNLHDLD